MRRRQQGQVGKQGAAGGQSTNPDNGVDVFSTSQGMWSMIRQEEEVGMACLHTPEAHYAEPCQEFYTRPDKLWVRKSGQR